MRHLSGFSSGVSSYAFCVLVLLMTSSTTSLSQILLFPNSPQLPFSPFQETPLFSFHSPPKVFYFFHSNPLILRNLSKMDSCLLCVATPKSIFFLRTALILSSLFLPPFPFCTGFMLKLCVLNKPYCLVMSQRSSQTFGTMFKCNKKTKWKATGKHIFW